MSSGTSEDLRASLGRRLWAVGLTGLPFALFKVGGGLAAAQDVHAVIGVAIMLWGALDVVLNLASLLWPDRVSYCLLSSLGRWIDAASPRGLEPLGLAIDTLLAFAIVSTMIWFERTAALPAPIPTLWKLAVIGSILGVGVEHVWLSVRNSRRAIG